MNFLKIFALTHFLPLFALNLSAHAATPVSISCKKKIRMTQSAYNWAQVHELSAGQFVFYYGNGIDTQMLTITFQSPLKKGETPGTFEYSDAEYSLFVVVSNETLQFEVRTPRKTKTYTDYDCS